MLQTGFSEHAIVVELIRQHQFDRVLPEMKNIFDLGLPDQDEGVIAQSASVVAKLLVEERQALMAHEVLDEALARMNRNLDKANILVMKAWVYAQQGDISNATKTIRRSEELKKIGDTVIKKSSQS